jgi:hypothetical protein
MTDVSIHIRTNVKPIGSPRKNNSNTLLSDSDRIEVSCELLFGEHSFELVADATEDTGDVGE